MPARLKPSSQRQVRLARLQRFAALLAPVCLGAAVVLPLVIIFVITRTPAAEIASRIGLEGVAVREPTPWTRAALVLLAVLPISLLARGLLQARRTLTVFSRGQFFTAEAIAGLQGLAAAAWASAAAALLVPTLASVLLTWDLGPGARRVAFTLGSGPLLQMATAGLVWLLAGVMAEARAIADENAQFV